MPKMLSYLSFKHKNFIYIIHLNESIVIEDDKPIKTIDEIDSNKIESGLIFNINDESFTNIKTNNVIGESSVRRFFSNTQIEIEKWISNSLLPKYICDYIKQFVIKSNHKIQNFGTLLVLFARSKPYEGWLAAGINIDTHYDTFDSFNVDQNDSMQSINPSKNVLFFCRNFNIPLTIETIRHLVEHETIIHNLKLNMNKTKYIKHYINDYQIFDYVVALMHQYNCDLLALDYNWKLYVTAEFIQPIDALMYLTDYNRSAQRINDMYNTKNTAPKYPKMLISAHDIMVRNAKTNCSDETIRKFNNNIRTNLEYKIDKQYSIIVPKNVRDIILESVNNSHCVDGYIESIANKQRYVMFLRHNDALDTSLVTIDLNNNNIVNQARGYANCNISFDQMIALIKYCNKFNFTISCSVNYEDPESDEHKWAIKNNFTIYDIAKSLHKLQYNEYIKEEMEKAKNATR